MTFPEPVPDYSPAELESIRLAEEKRARRALKKSLILLFTFHADGAMLSA